MNLREWALPIYTTLMQISAGAFVFLWAIRAGAYRVLDREQVENTLPIPVLIIFSTILAAMIGAHFHLSKPYLSFLALLNIRRSWLSREIAFTVLFFLSVSGVLYLSWGSNRRMGLKTVLGWAATAFSSATIFCMAKIYQLPTQITWNSYTTIIFYFGTVFILGPLSLLVILLMDYRFSQIRNLNGVEVRQTIIRQFTPWIVATIVAAALLVAALTVIQVVILQKVDHPSAQMSLRLMLELYRPVLVLRFVLLLAGVSLIVASWRRLRREKTPLSSLIAPVYLACVLVLVSEILGRFLFYATHVRVGI